MAWGWWTRIALLLAISAGLLPGAASAQSGKATAPVPAETVGLMRARDMDPSAPILLRTFKKEAELEVWKMTRGGRYALLKTFPICRWSGQLGPKEKVGDRQSPEGFYQVGKGQMNPNSAYHLSFDLGYPNSYDRFHGGTGSALMVHGICSSMGCYAMTNGQIQEIFGLARDALGAGQRSFQVQAYPFRMTAQNMARVRTDKYLAFWQQLKEGSDRFEATGEELGVGVSGTGRYTFAPSRNPTREAAAQARLAEEARKTAALVEDGAAAVRIGYQDGGTHPVFAALMRRGAGDLGPVSRPEALAFADREVVVIPARKAPLPTIVLATTDPTPVVLRLAPVGFGTEAPPSTLFVRDALGTPIAAPAVMAGSIAPILGGRLHPSKPDRLALRQG